MPLFKVRVRVTRAPALEDYFVEAENEREARHEAENHAAGDYPEAHDIEAIRSRIAEDGE